MVGWHHQFNGHELGQTLGDGEGQGGLPCCRTWGQDLASEQQQQYPPWEYYRAHHILLLLADSTVHSKIFTSNFSVN